jgi:hypothetical protein
LTSSHRSEALTIRNHCSSSTERIQLTGQGRRPGHDPSNHSAFVPYSGYRLLQWSGRGGGGSDVGSTITWPSEMAKFDSSHASATFRCLQSPSLRIALRSITPRDRASWRGSADGPRMLLLPPEPPPGGKAPRRGPAAPSE